MNKIVYYKKKEISYPKSNKNNYAVLGTVILFIFLFCGLVYLPAFQAYTQSIKSPLGSISRSVLAAFTSKQFMRSEEQNSILLGTLINSLLTNSNGTFGIVVKNLKTGEMYEYNAHREFETGSLYKLWVMATTYDLINQGKIQMNDPLQENANTLDQIFNVDMDGSSNSGDVVSYTVKDALNQMITISDNSAALLLSERITLAKASQFLSDHGFVESKFGTETDSGLPVTTPSDIALFFEKLYDGKLLGESTDNAMLALLKGQKINGKIPRLLPSNIIIAHKTGELAPYSHDAGIIYTKKGDYILVVLSESDSKQDADEKIAQISQGIYQYFTGDTSKQ